MASTSRLAMDELPPPLEKISLVQPNTDPSRKSGRIKPEGVSQQLLAAALPGFETPRAVSVSSLALVP